MEDTITQEKRNVLVRIVVGVFWFILTLLLGLAITGAIVGGVSSSEINTAGMSISEAYAVGQQMGGNVTLEFMTNHSGKVILGLFIVWVSLSFLGVYPGVSKYKK